MLKCAISTLSWKNKDLAKMTVNREKLRCLYTEGEQMLNHSSIEDI